MVPQALHVVGKVADHDPRHGLAGRACLCPVVQQHAQFAQLCLHGFSFGAAEDCQLAVHHCVVRFDYLLFKCLSQVFSQYVDMNIKLSVGDPGGNVC